LLPSSDGPANRAAMRSRPRPAPLVRPAAGGYAAGMSQINYATPSPAPANSKGLMWTGRVLSTLVVLQLGVMSIVLLIAKRSMIIDGFKQQGYPAGAAIPVCIVEIVCALLYAIPQTAVLGAILLTGY